MLEKRKKGIEGQIDNDTDILNALDKMIELEKEKRKINPIKIIVSISGGVGFIMLIGLLCYRLMRADFSYDSILSILLAFFSIFISVFFYFKADETSTDFYKSSYDIMKDISVALGKIEERFGEKLNSLNDKISHLDSISSEKNEEIQEKKDDKDKIINELMDKANLDDAEKSRYRRQLADREKQIEELKKQKYVAEHEATILRSAWGNVSNLDDNWEKYKRSLLSADDIKPDKNAIYDKLNKR